MTMSRPLTEDVPRVVVGSSLLAGLTAAAVLLAGSGSLSWSAAPWLARGIGGLSVALVLVGGVAVAAVLLGFVRLAMGRRRADPDAPQPTTTPAPASRWQPIWAAVTLAVLGAPLVIFWLLPQTSISWSGPPSSIIPLGPSQTATGPGSTPMTPPLTPTGPAAEPSLWPILAVLGLLGLLAVAAIPLSRIRRQRRALLAPRSRQTPPSIDDRPGPARRSDELPAEPRAAVLACYRAMETALGEHGLARRRGETPTDLIRRAAAEHAELGRPGGRLCLLYDEARFSEHPLGSAQRQDAVDALTAARAALREPS